MNDGNVRQQIVDKIKNSSSILVTVSNDPSVDELSAALGLTILLNKLKKHATAVFSGAVPPAITFLDPQKTFENTVDSLRDFIIALDKEKADHLRYKVEGDVVRIFITPYRTTITSKDLDFSQGDYNVELVLALGVKNRDNLDKALEAHGRILHDASVITLSVGGEKSDLGSIDWRMDGASSLSEMIVSLSEQLKGDEKLLDEQISTAFLTGIVAATDRFSNNHTSSKTMTIAAQLMAAGANQQLIASKLQEAHAIGAQPVQATVSEDKPTAAKPEETKGDTPPPEEPKKNDGSLAISHEKEGDVDEVARQTAAGQQAEAAKRAEEALSEQLTSVASSPTTPLAADIEKELQTVAASVGGTATPIGTDHAKVLKGAVSQDVWQADQDEPMMGGTLNATTERAAEDARSEMEKDRNRTILNHGSKSVTDTPQPQQALPDTSQKSMKTGSSPVGPTIELPPDMTTDATPPATPAPDVQLPATTLADIDAQTRTPHEDARAAVHAAFETAPASTPIVGLPPLPDFSTLPPLPQLPDFAPAPVVSPNVESLGAIIPPSVPAPTPAAPAPADPGQFKIPGQS